MTSLKDELDEYLNREKKTAGSYFPSTESLTGLLTSSGEPNEPQGDSWFAKTTESSWIPGWSRQQRVVGFGICLLTGIFCLVLAGFYIPVLIFKARKFALLYTLGCFLIVFSFSVLWGPVSHLKHLFSAERAPFTASYFGTTFATLYFALSLQSTILTVISALAQVVALIWYVMSYIPGGSTGLKFFTKMFTSFVTKKTSQTLPV